MTPRQQLEAALRSGRLAHCYLLCGPRDLLEEVADRTARAYLCVESGRPDAADPCGVCASCRMAAGGIHPDLRLWEAERGVWRIEQVRALTVEAFHRPAAGDRRVHILADVHLLSGPSANALLKLLEDPPPGTLFLLLADEVAGLPSTLLSRCQLLTWHPAGAQRAGGPEGDPYAGLGAGDILARGRGSQLLLLGKRLAEGDGQEMCARLRLALRDRSVALTEEGKWEAARAALRAWEAVERAASRLEAHGNARLVWECLLLELADLHQALCGEPGPGESRYDAGARA